MLLKVAMMLIKLICVGKLKENAYTLLVNEFAKRLGAYTELEIIEVKDEKIPRNASEKEEVIVKTLEGNKILNLLKADDYVILFDLAGKHYSSIEFAMWLEKASVKGNSKLTFIIGGSLGFSGDVINRANERISVSNMTFSHQLMRVIALEQIYRAYKIINNEPYHK